MNAAGPVPAGQDIMVVLAPLGKGEAAPRYESLADGVARITTSEATDTVFLGGETDEVCRRRRDV